MTTAENELVLVDLSSIAYPIWMTAGNQPDQDYTSQQIIARVRALTHNHPHAAICCDSGRSFRHDASPTYKANRPERVEALHHQIRLAKEQLEADGYPVWGVRGFEADDVIATATQKALAIDDDVSVLIVSADKDLLQLVSQRVRVQSPASGSVYDADGVRTKYDVGPDQMRDFLTLVGDASDNVRGAEKIGPVKAAALLKLFGTLDAVYKAIDDGSIRTQPSILASLNAFRPRLEETRNLIMLRTDVELPFHEISSARAPKDSALLTSTEDSVMEQMQDTEPATAPPPMEHTHAAATEPVPPAQPEQPPSSVALATPQQLAATGEVEPAPKEWERGLDPRSMKEAERLSLYMHKSRMFSAYGSPEGVLSTIMVGRELGLPAMASLRSIHNIEGKHSLSAALMRALVLRSGMAEYFDPLEFTDSACTFVTKRVGTRKEVPLTHTIAMARRAFGFDVPNLSEKDRQAAEVSWAKSGWGKNPEDMLVARATARLARLIYPDLLAGLYTPEELAEIQMLGRAA